MLRKKSGRQENPYFQCRISVRQRSSTKHQNRFFIRHRFILAKVRFQQKNTRFPIL